MAGIVGPQRSTTALQQRVGGYWGLASIAAVRRSGQRSRNGERRRSTTGGSQAERQQKQLLAALRARQPGQARGVQCGVHTGASPSIVVR